MKAKVIDGFNHFDNATNKYVTKEAIADVLIWYVEKKKIRYRYTDEYGLHVNDTKDFELLGAFKDAD